MMNNERATAIWRAKLVLLFVGVPGLILAGASLSFNMLFAQQLAHSETDRIVLIAVAVAVSLLISGLPIAIDLLRRGDLRTIAIALWLACFLFSLVSATGFSTGTRTQIAAEADAAIADRAAVQRSVSRWEAEIAALPRHRPVGTVRGELRAAEASAGLNCAKARSRAARELCAPIFTLRTELAAAEDAARIESQLAQQRQRLAGMAVHGSSDAQADVLSWIGAGVLSADAWRKVMGIFTAALVEFGAAGCLLITGKSVAALLAPQPEAAPVADNVVTFVPGQPESIRTVDAETSWRLWFERCAQHSPDGRVKASDAFAHYQSWAAANGVEMLLKQTAFYTKMRENLESIGGRAMKSNTIVYENISLADLGVNSKPLDEVAE